MGRDDVGRAVLEWRSDSLRAQRQERDPCARTYDFLERLSAPGLDLAEARDAASGFNPYDHAPRSAPAATRRYD